MKRSYSVDNNYDGMRIDRWIRNNLGDVPQGLIEKFLRKGKIKVNKKKVKSSYNVRKKDEINVFDLNIKEKKLLPKLKYRPAKNIIKENENLIIENNDDFLVINKNAGISVQGGTKSKKNLIDIFANSDLFKDSKPYSVHRLDKETSGVFILAKNRKTAQLLTSLFRLRKIHKTYLAVCHGRLNKSTGELNNDLIRYELNKKIIEKAKTIYKVLDESSQFSLVEMQPITGRKHQLRKQLYAIGHSICGDDKYCNNIYNKLNNKNLMLHSYQIKFMIHKKKFTYRASLPNYFKKFLSTKGLFFSNSLKD